MWRRQAKPTTPTPKTVEDVAALNHYQILGLTEAASSEAIERSLRVERWPWHLLDEDARLLTTRRRIEAYGLLNNPRDRADYDRAHYAQWQIVSSVGEDHSVFGTAWVATWSVLAVLLFLGGPAQPARLIGLIAPGFEEIAVYHAAGVGCVGSCTGYYTREFLSNSGLFHWLMNTDLLWILPAATALTIGMTLRTAAARSCGWVIVTVRMSGLRDTGIRLVSFVTIVAIPVAVLVFYALAPPSGIDIPGDPAI